MGTAARCSPPKSSSSVSAPPAWAVASSLCRTSASRSEHRRRRRGRHRPRLPSSRPTAPGPTACSYSAHRMVDGAETRIVLIRHGEARAGVSGIIGGPKGDTGLTDLGRSQAELLRDRLARTGELQPDVLLASVLPRAI